ncbi:MAG: sulfotransferase domain-containing protein [Rhodospirillales bacterium]|nr:sulfotransferase domain-containing protein [Rhodospirillales bacterium]
MLDFLGIGAQKSGTTWLYFNLIRHPGLFLPSGIKELHFWDAQRDKGMDWYLSHFRDRPEGKPAGEITPAYAILDPEVIATIHAAFPALKLIYLMRNPVHRAWSSAMMALGRAEMMPQEASDMWFIDHFHSQGSTRRGDYETCLRNWFAVYPRERFLILPFDEIIEDPQAVLKKCAVHLEVDPAFFDSVPEEELRRAHFPGLGHSIRPSLHAHLVAQYTPRIRSLETFLGMDFSRWHRQNGMLLEEPAPEPALLPAPAPRPGLLKRLKATLIPSRPRQSEA